MIRREKQFTTLEDQLAHAELAQLHHKSVSAQSPTALGLVLACTYIARDSPLNRLVPWSVLTTLSVLWIFVMIQRWKPGKTSEASVRYLAISYFFAGLCWGSFPLWALRADVTLTGSLACTAAFTLATIKAVDASMSAGTVAAYILPVMTLTATSFVVHDLPMKWLLVLITAVHCFTLWRMYNDSRKALLRSICDRHESNRVLVELQGEQHRAAGLVSSLNLVNEKLGQESRTDGLTGLVNRAEFNRLLAERITNNIPTGVCFIDVDRFKTINDTYGHATGDQLLLEVAQRLRSAAAPEDVVARLGGDEFTCILNVSEHKTALQRAENLRTAFAEPITVGVNTISVTLSLGLALRRRKEDVRAVLSRADHALYESKANGRDRVSVDIPTPATSGDRIEQLTEALGNGSIDMLIQPIVSAGGAVGGEAFARWRQANGTLLDAGEFMRLARHGGLEQLVTNRVAQLVVDAAAHPDIAGTRLWLNVGQASIQQVGFDTHVLRMIARAGRKPHEFGLDITDIAPSSIHNTNDPLIGNIQRLRAEGVMIALDDSAHGFGVLEALRHLRVDAIKLDASLTNEITSRPIDRSLVASLVDTAHSLGVQVIAKGVETAEQRDALWRVGVDMQQGWAFAKPMSVDEFGTHIRDSRNAVAAT
jgi:diguanylate cyclase (GGDEF)-like protein